MSSLYTFKLQGDIHLIGKPCLSLHPHVSMSLSLIIWYFGLFQWEWEKWKYEKDCKVMFYSVVTGKPLRLNKDLTVDGLGEEKDRMGKI